jgi:hypothetical protein
MMAIFKNLPLDNGHFDYKLKFLETTVCPLSTTRSRYAHPLMQKNLLQLIPHFNTHYAHPCILQKNLLHWIPRLNTAIIQKNLLHWIPRLNTAILPHEEKWRSFYYSLEIFKWLLVPEVTLNQQTPFLT